MRSTGTARRAGPQGCGYVLTDRGRALAPVLQALWDWGKNAAPAQPR
ncbi:winged helix-turn-helix transcriptional regulator [Actinomadura decatromicini]